MTKEEGNFSQRNEVTSFQIILKNNNLNLISLILKSLCLNLNENQFQIVILFCIIFASLIHSYKWFFKNTIKRYSWFIYIK